MSETTAPSWICATRALKTIRHIQQHAPGVFPDPEPIGGYTEVVPLDNLNGTIALDAMTTGVPEEVRTMRFPVISNEVAGDLFSGRLIFVHLIAAIQGQNKTITLSDSDMETALAYATMAAVPISKYAALFGANSISVDSVTVPFFVTLDDRLSYTDSELRGWVDQIAGGFETPVCLVVLNPTPLVNVDGDPGKGVGGYHQASKAPYIFANVGGSNLTIGDEQWLYAGHLSHEMAEMVVDPTASGPNPEVCDPCGPNCNSTFLNYFDSSGGYISTSQAFPPPFTYSFFINGIMKPGTPPCPSPAPAANCSFSPCEFFQQEVDSLTETVKELEDNLSADLQDCQSDPDPTSCVKSVRAALKTEQNKLAEAQVNLANCR